MTGKHRYDLVFMDCEMPVLDGYKATTEIRQRENGSGRVPVVAMTARALEGDRQLCLRAGMDDYISKPLRLADFAYALNGWVGVIRNDSKSETRESELQGPAVGMDDLVRLRSLVPDEKALSELFDAFINQARDLIAPLHTAVENNDSAELRKLAHKLLGASANLGASVMSQICKLLEEKGRTQNLEGATEQIKQLTQELSRAELFFSSLPQAGHTVT
ncbi:MAG: response regulator [Pyrinomonadaceae bacterium]